MPCEAESRFRVPDSVFGDETEGGEADAVYGDERNVDGAPSLDLILTRSHQMNERGGTNCSRRISEGMEFGVETETSSH